MPLIRKDPAAGVAPAPAEVGVPEALDALRTGNAEERWRAARRLGSQPAAAATLADALRIEADVRVREATFTSLARLATPESLDAVIACVRTDDAALRIAALDALRDMMAAVRPRLPALLSDPDPDIRVLCCDLARELPPAEATALLCRVLESEPQVNVCAAAVDVLAELGEPACLPFLEKCRRRFAADSFLPFAIDIAAERVAAQGSCG